MTEAPHDPDSTLMLETAGALRLLFGKYKRRLREEAPAGDVSWPQLAVLGHLDREGPTTVTALAKREGVRPQSMGAIVAELEKMGFVTGAPDPEDGRQTILSITAACRVWIDGYRAQRTDWLVSAMRTKLSPDEQRALADAVHLFRRILEA